MIHSRDGVLWVICCVGFVANVTFCNFWKKLHLGFLRPQNFSPQGFRISMVFCIPQMGLLLGFFEWWLPSCHPTVHARLVDCLAYYCYIHTVTSLCHNGMKLLQSFYWPLGDLSEQSPCLVIQFGGMAGSWWYRAHSVSLWLSWLCSKGYSKPLLYFCTHPVVCLSTTLSWWSFESSLDAHGWVFLVKCTTQQRKPTVTADFILK